MRLLALIVLGLVALVASACGSDGDSESTEATSLNEVKKLLASDAEAGDNFGWSVALSGDTAVVGAFREDAGGIDAGAVYIFQRSEGGADNWGQVTKLTASDAAAGDQFGAKVAVSGDTAVAGAFLEDAGGGNAGAAYIFQRSEGGADNWGQVKKLTASDAEAGDIFGVSVAVSGDTAVVGASSADARGLNAGAAYVFQRDQGGADNWGQVTKLTASDAEAGDQLGIRVAISGDTAVVGANHEDAGGIDAGAAYIFQRDQGGADHWGQVKKLTASDAEAGDSFGFSVAVSGDTAVAGAYREDAGGDFVGAAYVFQRDQGGADNWSQVTKLVASVAEAGDNFGWSVAVSGDTAVVGTSHGIFPDSGPGAAYVFQRDHGGADNWGQVTKLTASDAQAGDEFGQSVAISGDTAVVGANHEGTGGDFVGAAYVFQRD